MALCLSHAAGSVVLSRNLIPCSWHSPQRKWTMGGFWKALSTLWPWDNCLNFLLSHQQPLSVAGQSQRGLQEHLTLAESGLFSLPARMGAVCRGIQVYPWLGQCFQVCQEDQNIPRLLLRSFCCCRQGHSIQLGVSGFVSLLLSS